MAITVFERHEKKYLVTKQQYESFLTGCSGRLQPDQYGSYPVMNLYYDTDHFDIIRKSIEKPVYKEKLRMRSYGRPSAHNPVFLELKKKYKGVSYKRRSTLQLADARKILSGNVEPSNGDQILKEILYFIRENQVKEKVQICYDRKAYSGVEDPELRVTFDSGIRFRQYDLGLEKGGWGTKILPPETKLLEIKLNQAMPLWLCRLLNELEIYPVSFSKYGVSYKKIMEGADKKEVIQSA